MLLAAERAKAEPGADMDTFGAGTQGPRPGRDYPPPTQSDAVGAELRLSLDGKDLTIRPGQAARVGRSPDNDLVTEAPTVSRHHAVLRQGNAGWEFENVGSAPTFLNGREVTRLAVDRPLALVLGSADGPVLRAEPPRARKTPVYAGAAGRPGPALRRPAGPAGTWGRLPWRPRTTPPCTSTTRSPPRCTSCFRCTAGSTTRAGGRGCGCLSSPTRCSR